MATYRRTAELEVGTGKRAFFTADLHLFHKNIIKYENRPFNDIDDMHETIIKNWNKVVKAEDKVFILGDLTFGKKDATKEIISELNGRKILVKGNHDTHPNQWYRDIVIEEVSSYPILYDEYFVLTHEPMMYLKEPFLNVFGHVHSSPNFNTFTQASICVCVERWGYAPVSFMELMKSFLRFQRKVEQYQSKL